MFDDQWWNMDHLSWCGDGSSSPPYSPDNSPDDNNTSDMTYEPMELSVWAGNNDSGEESNDSSDACSCVDVGGTVTEEVTEEITEEVDVNIQIGNRT